MMNKIIIIIGGIIFLAWFGATLANGGQKFFDEKMEQAYFVGQADYMKGVMKIRKDSLGCYHWTKSPWPNKKWPTFCLPCEPKKKINH